MDIITSKEIQALSMAIKALLADGKINTVNAILDSMVSEEESEKLKEATKKDAK